jgi:regulator of ribonuclease activity A|tara:strand:+ start:492 stop:977 length:486 start_codon:yes stop_codon:yes gene_type:complete
MRTNFTTADLWDDNEGTLICASSIFKTFGGKHSFYGEIVTLKVFEDNSFVRKMLEINGKGKVLVIDGSASLRCALVGDKLAELAIANNWEGIIVNGCIRDSSLINQMDIAIKALNTIPVKSIKRNIGEIDIPVNFSGISFIPKQFVYSDSDGILISIKPLL